MCGYFSIKLLTFIYCVIPQYRDDHIGTKWCVEHWVVYDAVDVADGIVIIFDFDVFIYELLFVI